jgi:hypothetical protein
MKDRPTCPFAHSAIAPLPNSGSVVTAQQPVHGARSVMGVHAKLTVGFGSRSSRCPTGREYVGMWFICGDVPESIQERYSDTHGQAQRCLVVRGERFKQFGQGVALRLQKLSP